MLLTFAMSAAVRSKRRMFACMPDRADWIAEIMVDVSAPGREMASARTRVSRQELHRREGDFEVRPEILDVLDADAHADQRRRRRTALLAGPAGAALHQRLHAAEACCVGDYTHR